MKSLAKKVVPFVLVLSSVAIAAGVISKEAVNQKVAAIIAPFANENTKIEIKFTDLNVDAVRALDFGLQASVWKEGSTNEMVLKIDNVQYHYGDGQNPTASAALSMNLDMVKAYGQPGLNDLADGLEELTTSLAESYGEKYGEAVTVVAKLEELTKDSQGDVITAKLHVTAVIDFSKLPAELKAEDVEFKSIDAMILANRQGFSASVSGVLNQNNKSFQQDQPGLKELIDALLNEDAQVYATLKEVAGFLNMFADSLVNQEVEQ